MLFWKMIIVHVLPQTNIKNQWHQQKSGNCTPDGRSIMREKEILEFLQPGEEKTLNLKFEAFEGQ